jgi:hypothetical protein
MKWNSMEWYVFLKEWWWLFQSEYLFLTTILCSFFSNLDRGRFVRFWKKQQLKRVNWNFVKMCLDRGFGSFSRNLTRILFSTFPHLNLSIGSNRDLICERMSQSYRYPRERQRERQFDHGYLWKQQRKLDPRRGKNDLTWLNISLTKLTALSEAFR